MGTAASGFEVTAVERLTATEGTVALALGGITVGGRPGGIAATVTITDGIDPLTMGVSRLDGESEWIVDSFGKAGAFPFFANGVGSRCTKLKAVKDVAIIAALDAAADAEHDCDANAVPYESDGALGHGWECGICGRFLQAG